MTAFFVQCRVEEQESEEDYCHFHMRVPYRGVEGNKNMQWESGFVRQGNMLLLSVKDKGFNYKTRDMRVITGAQDRT